MHRGRRSSSFRLGRQKEDRRVRPTLTPSTVCRMPRRCPIRSQLHPPRNSHHSPTSLQTRVHRRCQRQNLVLSLYRAGAARPIPSPLRASPTRQPPRQTPTPPNHPGSSASPTSYPPSCPNQIPKAMRTSTTASPSLQQIARLTTRIRPPRKICGNPPGRLSQSFSRSTRQKISIRRHPGREAGRACRKYLLRRISTVKPAC
jgi:hypothetical protein